jgi:hypothetical protein
MKTHPAVEERIVAIDPKWDGQMLRRRVPVFDQSAAQPGPTVPVDLRATLDLLGSPELEYARDLLLKLPPTLHDALTAPAGAEDLLYVLLLHPDAELRARQWHEFETKLAIPVLRRAPRHVLERAAPPGVLALY